MGVSTRCAVQEQARNLQTDLTMPLHTLQALAIVLSSVFKAHCFKRSDTVGAQQCSSC